MINILRNGKVKYLMLYTAVFALLFTVGYSTFIFGNQRFIYYGDALLQHYPALIYAGDYLRALPGHIMNGAIPMYDFSIGIGDDIFAPLMTHSANADIFNLLFAFIPRENAYTAYVIVFILRLYFSGLTFSYFCYKTFKADKRFILLGAFIYVFSGWTCHYGLRHTSFLIALMYLPLIIAGFDMVLRNKKPYLFIISVFLLGLASFYFMYMVTLFLIPYAFFRIHHLYGRNSTYLKYVAHYGLISVGYYLIGLMMAAVTLVPLLTAHFSIGRAANILLDNLLLYPVKDYLDMFVSFVAPIPTEGTLSYIWQGMSAITPLLVIMLYIIKPYRKHLIIAVSVTMLIQAVPLSAFVLSGFGYVANRSEFLFNFVYCIVIVLVLSDLYKKKEQDTESEGLSKNNQRINLKTIIALSAYSVVLLIAILVTPPDFETSVIFIRVAFAFVLAFTMILVIPADNLKLQIITEKHKPLIIGVLVIFNLMINVSSTSWFADVGYIDESAGEIFEDYVSVSDYVDDVSFYRQGTPFSFIKWHFNHTHYINSAMLFGYYGVSEYWSLGNKAYADLSFEMENMWQQARWRIHGLDNRTILNELTSVKYIFTSRGKDIVPFGYEFVSDLPARKLYENKYALPLGYTYDNSVSIDEYDKLHALDKQDTLMQAVVLPPNYANTAISDLEFNKISIPYIVTMKNGVSWENGILNVKFQQDEIFVPDDSDISQAENTDPVNQEQTRAILELDLSNQSECTGNCEVYIRFSGLRSADIGTTNGIFFVSTNLMQNITDGAFFSHYIDEYMGRDNHLLNIGYYEQPLTSITLEINDGMYLLSGLEVFCIPMDDYPESVEALSEDVLENIVIGTNSVTGEIALEKEKILVFSIPFSKGWSAKVNGESIELLQANTAFMAIPLTSGNYEIELTYVTPGLQIGIILSMTGLIAFAFVICGVQRRSYPTGV